MTSADTACIANMGRKERQKRLWLGVVGLIVCVSVAVVIRLGGASRWWQLVLFLPWLSSALGFFQAKAKTCVALARRGLRNLDTGSEAVTDAAELAAMRRQARTVYLQSFLAALAATAVSMLFH